MDLKNEEDQQVNINKNRCTQISAIVINSFYIFLYSVFLMNMLNDPRGNCYAHKGNLTPMFDSPVHKSTNGRDYYKQQLYDPNNKSDLEMENVSLWIEGRILIEIVMASLFTARAVIKLRFNLRKGRLGLVARMLYYLYVARLLNLLSLILKA